MTALAHDYNYQEFTYDHYDFDFFTTNGPQIGDIAPDFQALDLNGNEVRLSDFRGKVIVLESGSITCPMYVRNIDYMLALQEKYPDVVFLVLYVREAHPGSKISGHSSFEEKLERARRNAIEEGDTRTFLVDDMAGTAHNAYGLIANFIYVIDRDFSILYKADWAIPKKLDQLLSQIDSEQHITLPTPTLIPPTPRVFYRVFKRAGWKSAYDFFIRSNIRIPKTFIKLKRKWRRMRKDGIYG